MTSDKSSSQLISITNKVLGKIAKTTADISHSMIEDLMAYTIGGASSMTAEEIFNSFKRRAPKAINYLPSNQPIGPIGYKQEQTNILIN